MRDEAMHTRPADAGALRGLGDAGQRGGAFPRGLAGEGRSAAALARAMIDGPMVAGDGGLALAWAGHVIGCGAAIAGAGGEAQRRRWLPQLAAGARLGGWAHHEVALAGDPVGVQTRAIRGPDGWVLEGRKVRVVNAGRADVFVVTARSDPSRGVDGVSAFVVERGAPGLVVAPGRASAGAEAAAIGELVLDRCPVPEDSLIGTPGDGLRRAWRLVQRWERGLAMAPWIGLVRAGLARAVAHAGADLRYGAPRARSQALRARLADAATRLALCERVQARAAALLDRAGVGDDDDADRELARLRLFLGDGVAWLTREVAGLCEPASLIAGHPCEQLARDAAFAGLLGVEGDVLRAIVAGALLGLG